MCDLHKQVINQVYGEGDISSRIVVIGEAPGKDEDKQGRPFIGASGKLLREAIKPILDQCYITNIVKCFPHGTPNLITIDMCVRTHLINQIKKINPDVIILVGNTAKWYFPANISTAKIYKIIHPAYPLYGGGGKMSKEDWKEHVATTLSEVFHKYSNQERHIIFNNDVSPENKI